MRISDWSSDVCSSDLHMIDFYRPWQAIREEKFDGLIVTGAPIEQLPFEEVVYWDELRGIFDWSQTHVHGLFALCWGAQRSEEHTSELQSLMRISYAVFCLKKKKRQKRTNRCSDYLNRHTNRLQNIHQHTDRP